MKTEDVKRWLKEVNNEELEVVYLNDGQKSCVSPNMGYALRDEIFKWQDKLDNINYSEEGISDLYLLTEDILDILESRLELNPSFIEELESLTEDDFVKFELPKKNFFDYVNEYCRAEKIGDIVQICSLLISFVQDRIKNVECKIHSGRLWIEPIDNSSCSTSIISEALNIKSSNIDDSLQDDRVWSIHLYKR